MAKGSKGIGIRGELAVRDVLQECGFDARRGQQYRGSSDVPDVITESALAAYVHIEAKLVKGFITRLMAKAYVKAKKECTFMQTPVIVHRSPMVKGMTAGERELSQRWLVTVDAKFFFRMMRRIV